MRTITGSTLKYSATPAQTPAMCPSSGRRRSRRGPGARRGTVAAAPARRADVGGGVHGPSIGLGGTASAIGDDPDERGRTRARISGGPDARRGVAVGSSTTSMASRLRLDAALAPPPAGPRPRRRRPGDGRRGRGARPVPRRRPDGGAPGARGAHASPTASAWCCTSSGGRCSRTRTARRHRRDRPAAVGGAGRRARAAHARHRARSSAGPGWCSRPGWCGRWRCRRSGSGWCGRAPTRRTARAGLLWRAGGGGVLLVVGSGVLFASGGVLSTIGGLGLAVLATGVGVALLLGPWIVRLWRDLAVERRERIRSEERSEIAAHLHDSVLQTLALIQRADAPGRARTLARRQERELRAWLFDERPPDGDGAVATLERGARAGRHRRRGPSRRRGRPRRGGGVRHGAPARGAGGRRPRGGPQRRPPLGRGGGVRLRGGGAAAGHGLRPRPRQGLRPRRRRAGAGRRAGVDHRAHGAPRRSGPGAHRARRGHRGRPRGRSHPAREEPA